MADVYDPNIPLFANEKMIEVFKETDTETKNMLQALLRGEKVEWEEEHENELTRMKQGIS